MIPTLGGLSPEGVDFQRDLESTLATVVGAAEGSKGRTTADIALLYVEIRRTHLAICVA